MLAGRLPVQSFTAEDDHWLACALRTPWLRPVALSSLACARLMTDPVIAAWRLRAATAWPERLPQSTETPSFLAALAARPLLLALLEFAPITDPPLERLLCNVRRWLLETATSAQWDPSLEPLATALALQCDTNEFVWDLPDDERNAATELSVRVQRALDANADVPVAWLVVTSCYRPLGRLDGAERLLTGNRPAGLQRLIERQVGAPLAERALLPQIPRLTEVDTLATSAVRRHYEENPYPRWHGIARPSAPLSLPDFIANRVPGLSDLPGKRSGELRILNAGCGTGQQPIDTALRLAQAQVLAVDLSRASLAYATRMARQLDLKNIAFAQADLMRLGSLPDRFDLIESTGVLHHLADPAAGLAVLCGLLAPGGVMRLALYSARARTAIVAARALIQANGWQPDADGIRACRAAVLALPPTHPAAAVTQWTDFYTTSECRDQLFHPCEHQFDIAGLARLIAGAGLRLIGFELSAARHAAFTSVNSRPADLRDFSVWRAFEETHPDFFSEMYTVWVSR
jgi:SAM-dependent methyltransferase